MKSYKKAYADGESSSSASAHDLALEVTPNAPSIEIKTWSDDSVREAHRLIQENIRLLEEEDASN